MSVEMVFGWRQRPQQAHLNNVLHTVHHNVIHFMYVSENRKAWELVYSRTGAELLG